MATKQLVRMHDELTVAHQGYEKMLRAYALAKVHDPTLCEDLVQIAFLKTWVYLVKKGKIDLMKAFLYHILRNLIVDEYRKPKSFSLDDIMEKGFQPKARTHGFSTDCIDGEKAMLLINKLPEKYKQIMQMRFVQELSLKEMQTITGQSKNSIAVQVHRGLNKLRLLYNQKAV